MPCSRVYQYLFFLENRYEQSLFGYTEIVSERIQKILSARGICSRRKAEEYIERGLVKVNGEVASIGQKADPDKDRIEVDGEVLKEREEMLYYVMNKPIGVITSNVHRFTGSQVHTSKQLNVRTCQRANVQTVRDLLPKDLQGKVYPVGRLDKDTSGLLLFTNDGVLAYRLTHPKFDHEKEYEVTVTHQITDGQLLKLKKGITISGSKTKSATVKRISTSSFRIAITEGRNRQIRRMCQKVGAPVSDLKRVRIVTFEDYSLKLGQIRQLNKSEIVALKKSVCIE